MATSNVLQWRGGAERRNWIPRGRITGGGTGDSLTRHMTHKGSADFVATIDFVSLATFEIGQRDQMSDE